MSFQHEGGVQKILTGKGGVQKIPAYETLKTILQRRSEWLELPKECNATRATAATSLQYDFYSVEELPEDVFYHVS